MWRILGDLVCIFCACVLSVFFPRAAHIQVAASGVSSGNLQNCAKTLDQKKQPNLWRTLGVSEKCYDLTKNMEMWRTLGDVMIFM